MTGTKVGNAVFVKLVRQMGGTGMLPDVPDTRYGPVRSAFVDVCVVGAGPAGLAAALRVASLRPQDKVLVIDQQRALGGSWLAEPGGQEHVAGLQRQVAAANVDVWLGSTALGHYPEDDGDLLKGVTDAVPGVMAVLRANHVALIRARRFVFATGTYEQNLPFPSNDAPGVVAARALGRLVFARGLLPTRKVKLLLDSQHFFSYPDRLGSALLGLGVDVVRVEHNPGADVRPGRNTTVAVATLPAPAFELARHHGIETTMRPAAGGFAVDAHATGETTAAGVFVAGDVTGYVGPQNAETHGQAVGFIVASSL